MRYWMIPRNMGEGVRLSRLWKTLAKPYLALVNLKPDIGWFTWTNNRRGEGLVRK